MDKWAKHTVFHVPVWVCIVFSTAIHVALWAILQTTPAQVQTNTGTIFAAFLNICSHFLSFSTPQELLGLWKGNLASCVPARSQGKQKKRLHFFFQQKALFDTCITECISKEAYASDSWHIFCHKNLNWLVIVNENKSMPKTSYRATILNYFDQTEDPCALPCALLLFTATWTWSINLISGTYIERGRANLLSSLKYHTLRGVPHFFVVHLVRVRFSLWSIDHKLRP